MELSVLKISPNGKEEWMTTRVNPEMPIPPKSTAIHCIKDEDVVNSPTFKEVAKNLENWKGILYNCAIPVHLSI